jgi:hypothetical protein
MHFFLFNPILCTPYMKLMIKQRSHIHFYFFKSFLTIVAVHLPVRFSLKTRRSTSFGTSTGFSRNSPTLTEKKVKNIKIREKLRYLSLNCELKLCFRQGVLAAKSRKDFRLVTNSLINIFNSVCIYYHELAWSS